MKENMVLTEDVISDSRQAAKGVSKGKSARLTNDEENLLNLLTFKNEIDKEKDRGNLSVAFYSFTLYE